MRVPALAACFAVLVVALSLPAFAAGKRIFITKTDENFNGMNGVTFELYTDNPPVGGARGNEDTKVDTQTTDATGKATFENVAQGNYWVHEVTPAGYNDNPDESVKVGRKNKEIVFSNTRKPANNRVNDPTGDEAIHDGTHVSDFGPAIAALCEAGEEQCRVVAAWNDSAELRTTDGVSAVAGALSTDSGGTWGPQHKLRPFAVADAVLGEPAVAVDPTQDRFFVASIGFKIAAAFDRWPIFVARFGANGFEEPVNTWPEIPSGFIAHGPSIAADAGDVFLANTISLGKGSSEIAFSRSTDAGQTWSEPSSISGTGTYDHVDLNLGPNNNLYVAWADYKGANVPTYHIMFSRSINAGEDFREPVFVRQATPKPGTPGHCGSPSLRSVLGRVAAVAQADLAVDPGDVTRLYAVYPRHGQGGDESDVFYSTSHDGGLTWGDPELVGSAEGTQWAPHVDVAPDGRVAITFWESEDGSTVDPKVAYYDPFEDGFLGEPRSLTNGNPFPLWQLAPSFDSELADCFGLGDPAVVAPGSGFFFAWADGRDPGPAGNGGVDPNIYSAHDIGPFLSTSTSLSVSKTASELEARGRVAPAPLAGARVSVTLFVDDGGGFDRVGRKRAKTGAEGAYSASFTRPDVGRCRLVVVFEGSEGREPSPATTKTFSC